MPAQINKNSDEEQRSDADDLVLHVITSDTNHHFVPMSRLRSASSVIGVTLLLIVVVAVLTVLSNNQSSNTANTASIASPQVAAKISITGDGFSPKTISVKAGQAVTWINSDSQPHQIASDPYPTDNTLSSLNSKGTLISNDSFSYVFNKPGTYSYHDDLNPYNFDGTVIVK